MGQAAWVRRPPPASVHDAAAAWQGHPATPGQLTRMRVQLRQALLTGALAAGQDHGERLLLAFEELVSNGLRHGRPPVEVAVIPAGSGWLLEVSDGATDRPPVPAIGRDAAEGGMGLGMVARICGAHGWSIAGDRKIVWARVDSGPSIHERVRAATDRAHELAVRLSATATRTTLTLDRLVVVTADGVPPRELEQLRRTAEQLRRVSLAAAGPPGG
ncbi:ATP-binding protein [Geodermatophilus sp. SYSU D01186]